MRRLWINELEVWTVHDHSATGRELAASYPDDQTVRALLDRIGPLGRRLRIAATPDTGQPVIVSEFGGISVADADAATSWGNTTAAEPAAYEEALRDQFRALQESPVLAGTEPAEAVGRTRANDYYGIQFYSFTRALPLR